MTRTRVKICGLTRPQDIQAAVHAGADAVGFVYYAKSKRYVSLKRIQELQSTVPVWVDVVVLMVSPTVDEVHAVIDQIKPSLLQFHGDETPAFCESFNYPYIRAIRVGAPNLHSSVQIAQVVQQYTHAKGFIFDAYSSQYGGSGLTFDLGLLCDVRQILAKEKIIIAGGLNIDNIAALIHTFSPYAVDLSSGVELEPGIKSKEKLTAFFSALYSQNKIF